MCKVHWTTDGKKYNGVIVGFLNYKEQIQAIIMVKFGFENVPITWLVFDSWTE